MTDKAKILIVDDERFNINLLNDLLRNEYKIMVATNGEQALKAALTGKPDLILLDILMPGIDGYEVLMRLKTDEETANIPVIFISAINDADEETRGFELGAVDFIAKPFNQSVVKARVSTQMRLKHKSDLLEKMVAIDSLTEIPNRRAFDEMRDKEWRRNLRYERNLALAMIDVDMFKQYNDRYGHHRGDECLSMIAHCLTTCIRRPGDFVARYGGEEFAVILPDTDHVGAMHMAEIFRQSVRQMQILHEDSAIDPYVTISVGIASTVANEDCNPYQLTEAADRKLYEAKEAGRNRAMGIDLNN